MRKPKCCPLCKSENILTDDLECYNCGHKWYRKETRGGTRQGSGAKPKYNEETKTVAFRCPLSKVDELKIILKSKLSEWSVK